MKRHLVLSVLLLLVLLALSLPASAVTAPKDTAQNRLDVYTGEVTPEQLNDVVGLGVDRREMHIEVVPGSARGAKSRLRVETVLSGRQADSLRAQGIDLQAKTVGGATTAQKSTALAAEGFEVFKKYSGPGGIKEEFEQVAAANPEITKLVVLGKTHQGQDIVAMKVTREHETSGMGFGRRSFTSAPNTPGNGSRLR